MLAGMLQSIATQVLFAVYLYLGQSSSKAGTVWKLQPGTSAPVLPFHLKSCWSLGGGSAYIGPCCLLLPPFFLDPRASNTLLFLPVAEWTPVCDCWPGCSEPPRLPLNLKKPWVMCVVLGRVSLALSNLRGECAWRCRVGASACCLCWSCCRGN